MDNGFSTDFYKYFEESHNKEIQKKKLQENNDKIIKSNLEKLENCIKIHQGLDRSYPYDNTFICDGFHSLLTNNNNNNLDKDSTQNLLQYKNAMKKINIRMIDANEKQISPLYRNYNTIPKNTYAFYNNKSDDYNCNNFERIIIRISNN